MSLCTEPNFEIIAGGRGTSRDTVKFGLGSNGMGERMQIASLWPRLP